VPSSESAIRAWINTNQALTGEGNPLSRGAYLAGKQPRSPADGAYALLTRANAGSGRQVVAEDSNPSLSRITALVYAGTIESAEAAAVALSEAWHGLTGVPEPCGDTGVTILVAANHIDPAFVPTPATGGEQYCFLVSAEFMLLNPPGSPPD
jgi:hypothetical protein